MYLCVILNLSFIILKGLRCCVANIFPFSSLFLFKLLSVVFLLRCAVLVSPTGIVKLSSYPQRGLQNHSITSCIEVASHLLCSDYTVIRGMGTSGNVEYRCWPSYSQQGCVLSVHSAREAAYICNSHSQCNSFTLSGQKTWTGMWCRRWSRRVLWSKRKVLDLFQPA